MMARPDSALTSRRNGDSQGRQGLAAPPRSPGASSWARAREPACPRDSSGGTSPASCQREDTGSQRAPVLTLDGAPAGPRAPAQAPFWQGPEAPLSDPSTPAPVPEASGAHRLGGGSGQQCGPGADRAVRPRQGGSRSDLQCPAGLPGWAQSREAPWSPSSVTCQAGAGLGAQCRRESSERSRQQLVTNASRGESTLCSRPHEVPDQEGWGEGSHTPGP